METKIEVLYCDKHPLEKIGRLAGICWNAPLDDIEKNARRAIDCIKATHWRVLEFVEVTVLIQGFSARAMRELYTHIGGSPTRLQESTRYVAESGFSYYIPAKIAAHQETEIPYVVGMGQIQESYNALLERGVAKEDAANLLPLGMHSKMVWKVNLRTLVNFFNRRLCMRALKEIRDLAGMLRDTLASIDDDWKFLSDSLFVPMCEIYKWRNPALCFCQETRGCGRYQSIEEFKVSTGNPVESGEPYLPKCIGWLQSFDLNKIKPMVDSMTSLAGKSTFGLEDGDRFRAEHMRDAFLEVSRWLTETSDVHIRDDDVMLHGKYGERLYMTATCRNNDMSRRYEVARLCLVNDATEGGVYWAFVRSDPQTGTECRPVRVTPEAVVDFMKYFLKELPWNS